MSYSDQINNSDIRDTLHDNWVQEQENSHILNLAQQIQQECHRSVENLMKQTNKVVDVQDATNVFFFRKLAEFEYRLRNLEAANGRTQTYLNMHTPLI